MPTAAPSLGGRIVPAEGEVPLPRPPGAIRRFLAAHPWFTDSAVAALYLVPTLLAVVGRAVGQDEGFTVPALLDSVGIVVSAAALLFRRYRPWTVLAITGVATLAMLPVDGGIESAMAFALYALAVYRSASAAWTGFGAAVLLAAAAVVAGFAGTDQWPFGALSTVIGHVVMLLLGTLIGVNVGNRKRYVQALVDRAQQLARERDQQAQLAAASERSRIAREMHDIVSHGITVMVRLAEGSAVSAVSEPARASQAMHQVADTGRQALRDMRRMLGVLNDEGDQAGSDLQPQPGVADLDALIESSRAAGLPVTMTSSGESPTDPAEQLAIYRIVQESLTNALRHAVDPRSVVVTIAHGTSSTIISVVDDGRGSGESSEPGHGLLGMRERAALYGGSVQAEPAADGGWAVHATVPRGMTA